ncbi:MAG TPA: cytochrome c oxidase subunit II [Bryobacteraceae bacterium]|nr:cytochrome c oxidase subunit II [Bryobacteraceae bacterium]
MNERIRLFPDTASTVGSEVNHLFTAMVLLCGLVAIGIAIFAVYCMVRYHRRRDNELPPQIRYYIPAEATWIIVPFILFMGMYAWGAKVYFDIERPPSNAINMFVIGKQWMWKVQYPGGQREINALHIPVGTPIRLNMTSQDVIHSFFIPAFRTKQDVLPDRYTTTWFEATKPGKYHLFCAEYCGTKHSGMIGYVYAMSPHDYQAWLTRGAAEGSLASRGEKLFHQYGCANCHHFENAGRCPTLRNLYGRPVEIEGGQTVIANDTYIRESILQPRAKIVWGFRPIMPTFQGQISEDNIVALIAYIRAIGTPGSEEQPTSSGSSPAEYGTQPGIAGPGTSGNSGTQPADR